MSSDVEINRRVLPKFHYIFFIRLNLKKNFSTTLIVLRSSISLITKNIGANLYGIINYIHDTSAKLAISKTLGMPGVQWQPQIFSDQLTLSQPSGADYAHQIILAPPVRIFRPSNGPGHPTHPVLLQTLPGCFRTSKR